jgi:hypothetical protein
MSQVRDIVRELNKHVGNPAMMPMSGRKHYYASVIEHTGRRSGKHYATTVVTDRTADDRRVGGRADRSRRCGAGAQVPIP